MGEGAKRVTTLIGANAGWSKRARGSTREAFSPSGALNSVLARQRDRWVLWLPLAMIVGSAAWMLAPSEPPVWIGPVACLLGIAAASAFAMWPHATSTGWAQRLSQVSAGFYYRGDCRLSCDDTSWLRRASPARCAYHTSERR